MFFLCFLHMSFSTATCSCYAETMASLLSLRVFKLDLWDFLLYVLEALLFCIYFIFILPQIPIVYLHVGFSLMLKTSLTFLVVLYCLLTNKCMAAKRCLGTLHSHLMWGFMVCLSDSLGKPCHLYLCIFLYWSDS